MKKRIFALMLSVLLIAASASIAFATEPAAQVEETGAHEFIYYDEDGEIDEEYHFVEAARSQNGRFILCYDAESTFISVEDTTTGQIWYSNPPVQATSLPTEIRTYARSALIVNYTNSALMTKSTNSAAHSVNKKDACKTTLLDNGIRFDYDFPEQKFTIPVQFTIDNDGLNAQILLSEIKEYGENTVNDIDFLKYFAAAQKGSDGYLVVPDGSGAIIEFDNGKNLTDTEYKKEFYGIDMSMVTNTDLNTSRSEKVSLPVFGLVTDNPKYTVPTGAVTPETEEAPAEPEAQPEGEAQTPAVATEEPTVRYGILAEVTSGAEIATLKANVSGNKLNGDYNMIYTNIFYRINYDIPLKGQTDVADVMYNAEDITSLKTYEIHYYFTGADSTYTTLASKYREVLTDRGWLTKDGVTERFYMELYGAVNKKKSFAGIVYNARETLTSFKEAQAIMQELQTQGGVNNLHVMYSNFSDDFFSSDIEIKLNASGSLGGQADLTSLMEYAKGIGADVAVAADFVTLPGSSNGFSTFWDVADVINISPIEVYPFSLNGNSMDTSKSPYYLLDPQKYASAVDTLLSTASEKGYTAMYFDEESVQLYSDLAPGGFQSERTSVAQAEQFKRLADAGVELTMSDPNVYLYAYADFIVDIPVCSSKEIIFDEDVPFLQAVLRGMKNFGGESMNINEVSDESFLRHLEYGTDMKYSLINAETKALLKTDHTFLYSATFGNFKDQIKERYAAFMELGAKVGDACIAEHERLNGGDVAITTYDNDVKIYINYGSEAYTSEDGSVTVDAMSYKIV